MADRSGPFVHVATFCRDVVEQADGAVTLVGVTDNVHAEVDDDGARFVDLTLFISIRGGDLAGKHEIVMRPEGPSGQPAFARGGFPALFEGGGSGVEIQVRASFEVSEEGPYWFDLLLDDRQLLTRIPLEIRFESASTRAGEPISSP